MGDNRIEPGTKFLRIGQAAKLLGLTIRQVHARIAKGEIEAQHYRGRWRFPVASLLARAAQRGELSISDGERDAQVFSLIRDGKSDEEIVVAIRVTIERVRMLREATGGPGIIKTQVDDEEEFRRLDASLRARIEERLKRIRSKRIARSA